MKVNKREEAIEVFQKWLDLLNDDVRFPRRSQVGAVSVEDGYRAFDAAFKGAQIRLLYSIATSLEGLRKDLRKKVKPS